MKKDINVFRLYQELTRCVIKEPKLFRGLNRNITYDRNDIFELTCCFFEFEHDEGTNNVKKNNLTKHSVLWGLLYFFLLELDLSDTEDPCVITQLFEHIVKEVYRIFEIKSLKVNNDTLESLEPDLIYPRWFGKNNKINITILAKNYLI